MAKHVTNTRVKDNASKLIFTDAALCAQFLRGYVDIPLLREVQAEDIEDVTNRYVHMFTEERNSDNVKRVKLKINETPFFVVSLIEHKSNVDYNIVMQIFRYMVFIWEDYEREMERQHAGISRTKDFRYPPILPIVFYDGADNWTAPVRLRDRVLFSDMFGEYIPDYRCILIKLRDYSNAELMKKKDELSVIMLVDKLSDAADYTRMIQETGTGYFREIAEKSPEYLLDIMSQIVEVFLAKLNIPQEEADAFTEQIKERRMGELFAHFQGWDVQAIRKEAREEARKEARKEAREELREEVRKELREEAREEARKEAREEVQKEIQRAREEIAKEATEEVRKKITEEVTKEVTKEVTEQIIASDVEKMLLVIRKLGGSKETAVQQLMEQYELTEELAIAKADQIFK